MQLPDGEGKGLELSVTCLTQLSMRLTKCDVANVSRARSVDAWNALELERGVVSEEHLGRILDSSPSGIDKFLQEDLSKDPVCLFPEDGGEDDCDTIEAGLDVDCLLLTVVDGAHLTALLDTLGRGFGCVLGSLLLKLCELVEGLLEGGSHCVALEERYAPDEIIAALCQLSANVLFQLTASRTLIFWQVLQIYQHGKVVP